MATYPLSIAEAVILECQIRQLELREKLQAQVDAMEAADAEELNHHMNTWRDFLKSKNGQGMSVTTPRVLSDWDVDGSFFNGLFNLSSYPLV